MWRRLASSRWRHVAFLVPAGTLIGLAVGGVFRDLVFGLAAGSVMGTAFGLLLALRNPH